MHFLNGKVMEVNQKGIDLIKHFEGLNDGDLSKIGLQPKCDPVGIWTCGWGHALRNEKGAFLKGDRDKVEAYQLYGYLDEQGANQILIQDLRIFSGLCDKGFLVKPNSDQYSAMISLAFNIGADSFLDSSVLKRFNTGNIIGAADAFSMWNRARTKNGFIVLPGLTKRRQAEVNLFMSQPVVYA